MTNDYAALVAMLDQAAADLQAEIDAAIDRHGLLVRTADSLRAEAAGVIRVPRGMTLEDRNEIRKHFQRIEAATDAHDPANCWVCAQDGRPQPTTGAVHNFGTISHFGEQA